MRLAAALGLVLSALAACATTRLGPLLLSVSTDKGQYAAGDTVFARLSNLSDGPLSYNPCLVAIDRYGSEGWEEMTPDSGRPPCLTNLDELAPSASALVAVPLAQTIGSGVFRVRFRTVFDPSYVTVSEDQRSSNAFRVP